MLDAPEPTKFTPTTFTQVRAGIDDAQYAEGVVQSLVKKLRDDPNDAQARNDLGAWLLSYGNFDGWQYLIGRFGCHNCGGSYDFFPIPIWDGEDLTGKRVLYWLEQGVGDQLFHASMVEDLAKICDVTVYCARRLNGLFKRSFPGVKILSPGELREFNYDYQMTYSDVGQVVRKSFEQFPKKLGFLKADSVKTAELRAKYQAINPGNKIIGVSWRSSNPNQGPGKSIPLEFLAEHLKLKGITFVSLQFEETEDELKETRIYRDDTIHQGWDMESFAAQVAAMDGVLTVSNTTLHTAGALGKRTLGMLARGNCRWWYWFTGRVDSPFYPSVELVRCHEDMDWRDPMIRAWKWLHE